MAVSPFDYEAALAACAAGDERAFQALYEHESPRMLALSLKLLTNPVLAQQLVADTFMSIWKHARSYDTDIGPARAWVYSIMRHRALHQLRQSGGAAAQPQNQDLQFTASGSGAHKHFDGVAAVMNRLNEAQRRAILLAFYHGHTYDEIAARLGLQVSQLRDQVRHGLNQLQECQPA